MPFTIEGHRALEHVTFLADSIGPRVTGSVEDRITRDYITEKMQEIGLEVERQNVSSVWAANTFMPEEREYTINSQNIIGTLRGRTGRTIIISGHFDSWGRSSPGANDDASAIGVMLEVANAIKDYEWESTIVFAAFCAEERGLLGSKYYVENTDLNDLVFAINLDPVGYGNLVISPLPDSPPISYQRELLRLARRYGIGNVSVDPMQVIIPRYMPLGFGADHMSFLDAGYNAFSINNSILGWNYHTTHDKTEYIDPVTLRAAAELVVAFLLEYDDNKEPPVLDTSVYVAQPIIGNYFVFIVHNFLLFIFGLSILAFLYFGIAERHTIKNIKPLVFISIFFKMLFLAFIQVAFVFLPVVGGMILERSLYPWMANPVLYMVMGITSGLVGLFFIIQISRLMAFNPGERPLKYWAILVLLFYTLFTVSLFGLDVAYYFAAPLLLFLLSLKVKGTFWLLLIGGIGIFPLFGSIAPAQISMIITLLGVTVPVFTLMVTVFLLAFPFIFYFAAALQGDDKSADRVRKTLSHAAVPAIAMIGLIGLFYWAQTMEIYHENNPQLINQSAFLDLNAEEGTLFLASYDYLPVLRDDDNGQFIEPDGFAVRYPLELDPGITDLLIESESLGDTLLIHLFLSEPEYRDYISVEVRSDENFEVLERAFDDRRSDRRNYYLGILSAEGEYRDTLILRRTAPVRLNFSIHTFDASQQPVLREVVHPIAYRYYQRLHAVIEID